MSPGTRSPSAPGPGPIDPLLLPFLQEAAEPESRRLLGELIQRQAEPLIRAIARRRLAETPEAEDASGRAAVQLVARLEDLRSADGGGAPTIADFRRYVCTVAHHACDDALRRKYPQRWRLHSRLRYLLSHQPDFALWQTSRGQWLCGLAEWRGQDSGVSAPARGRLPAHELRLAGPFDVLSALFREAAGPLDLDDVVALTGKLWGMKDIPLESREKALADAPSVALLLDLRSYLERLWTEIGALPPRQRKALLLGLQDERTPDIINVFPVTGVASVRAIAEALELSVEELAALWPALPLDDRAIASRLGLTRQQVINLRKAARARLGRRMKAFGDPPVR